MRPGHSFSFLFILCLNYAVIESETQNIKNISVSGAENNSSGDIIVTTTETNSLELNNSTEIESESETESTKSVEIENDVDLKKNKNPVRKLITKKLSWSIDENPNYIRGYFGGYYLNGTDDSHYFAHGKYQKVTHEYYGNYEHKLEDKSPLGYYLGFGLLKMNHNEYFIHNNFTHFDIHHYYYQNNTMLPELSVGTDQLNYCPQNTSRLCPVNTEAICLWNTTVWCATKVSFVKPCEENNNRNECVVTRIPCVKQEDVTCNRFIETVKLPCISKITIVDADAGETGQTFNTVAGTFVLVPVLPIEERKYCITVVAEPIKGLQPNS
ncbi:hypothetical protein HHI36_009556 [Cryptolaemus montrouzieri]|uniref:Uncharacterized protein n=1 Tax=Cryptolaemus montrouzieri TaxID=559131 RepID=A0ABD2MG33_9CUCU